MAVYDATVEIHSLVHRRVHTDANGSCSLGVDRIGQPLRPMLPSEHEALARVVLVAADQGLAPTTDERSTSRLVRHLADLAALYGQSRTAAGAPDVVPELMVIIDPDPADPQRYLP